MSTMRNSINNIVALAASTDKASFAKTPQGYQQRNEACLAQLCFHENVDVRKAVANLPLLRDKFVLAMYERETVADVKAILAPRAEDAMSKSDKYASTIEAQAATIDDLRRQLES